MKKLFIVLAILSSSLFSTVYANECTASPLVVSAFTTKFTKATEVKWTEVNSLYKVTFKHNEQAISAFYNADAQLVAVIKNISFLQLPLSLQKSLKTEMKSSWITELFEMTNEEGTSYFVCLENADEKIVLKSAGKKKWGLYNTITKN